MENFSRSNLYEGLEKQREAKKPLPTMPLKEHATNEELSAYVHGLVLVGETALVFFL